MYRRPSLFVLPATLLLSAATGAAQSSTVNVQVSNQINPAVGVNGRLQVAMSTNFQLVNYSAQLFAQTPQALPALSALQPRHTRVQLVQGSDPLTSPAYADSGAQTLPSQLTDVQLAPAEPRSERVVRRSITLNPEHGGRVRVLRRLSSATPQPAPHVHAQIVPA